ncbi:Uncharacterised protein [Mycobacteroides abscessus subsp. abscessus]|nr:Uncharacterised protein [Mycobacteroides abscessus subsp. abscessus]
MNAKLCVGTCARCCTHHCWKWMARCSPSVGSVITTWVSQRSSLAGNSRTPGCHRLHNASVTADSG